jgi:RNA polymerase sigma-70 factor, ECF subfamily
MFCKRVGVDQKDAIGIESIDALYGYALSLSRNRSDAEDLVQETYVRAMRAVGSLREDSNIKAWLFTVLRNIWLTQVRKKRTGPEFVETDADCGVEVAEPSKTVYEIYADKLERQRVQDAIQKLPVEFREIILLREYEELSYQDIAKVLNCPMGTVMSRLGRARKKLRLLLSAPPTGTRTSPKRNAT